MKTPQQQIDELVERVAIQLCEFAFTKGGEMHSWELCHQKSYMDKAKQIIPIISEEIKRELEMESYGDPRVSGWVRIVNHDWQDFWRKRGVK